MTLRAVLFDLDGTLYDSGSMKIAMASDLVFHTLLRGPGDLRRVRAFRKQFESLRELGRTDLPLADLRFERAASACGQDPSRVRETFEEWMVRRPGKHLRSCMRKDLPLALARFEAEGLKLGVFSDHPVEAKLRAMGVRDSFSLALSAMDPEINALKPHPRGFQVACERWGVEPAEVVYVGDREDVDAQAAEAAGMRSVLVGIPGSSERETVLNFTELVDLLVA